MIYYITIRFYLFLPRGIWELSSPIEIWPMLSTVEMQSLAPESPGSPCISFLKMQLHYFEGYP